MCARLAALGPPPWQNQVCYSGVLAPVEAGKFRNGNGCRCWPWRLLKARTFGEPTKRAPVAFQAIPKVSTATTSPRGVLGCGGTPSRSELRWRVRGVAR